MATPIKPDAVPANVPLLLPNGFVNPIWILFFQRLADAVKQLQP